MQGAGVLLGSSGTRLHHVRINLMQHGGTKSEPETPRTISVKLSPTFCAYCGKPLKIIGTERFCNNVQCFNRFQNV